MSLSHPRYSSLSNTLKTSSSMQEVQKHQRAATPLKIKGIWQHDLSCQWRFSRLGRERGGQENPRSTLDFNNKGVSSFPGRIGHIRATSSHSFTPDTIVGLSLKFWLHDTVFLQSWQDCESRLGQEYGFEQGSALMFTFEHPTQPKLLDI